MSIHKSQVTFFEKADNNLLQEQLDKYRHWLETITYSDVTGKEGRVVSVQIENGNIWFNVSTRDV